MYFSDPLRRLLEERDHIKQRLDAASGAARFLEDLEYPRRMLEALSSAQLYMTDSAIAGSERAMRLHDAMTYSMHPVLDANQPPPTHTLPPLRPLTNNMAWQLKKRVDRLEREVEQLKAKFNPPPPPPRKDGEESAGGQYL
jgi:hypothetical protein